MSPIVRRIPRDFDPQGEGGEEDQIVRNLEGITRGVPDYAHFDDVPCAYQRHTVGVPNQIHRLLRRLVRAMTCYHEHDVDYTPRFILSAYFARHDVSGCIRNIHIFFDVYDAHSCKHVIYIYIYFLTWICYI